MRLPVILVSRPDERMIQIGIQDNRMIEAVFLTGQVISC